jgi:hypothetical protein
MHSSLFSYPWNLKILSHDQCRFPDRRMVDVVSLELSRRTIDVVSSMFPLF